MARPGRAALHFSPPLLATADARTALPAPKTADAIYATPQYRRWREAVIARAGGRCQAPGCGRGGRLYADHIQELKDGGAPFDLANGQALCPQHHTAKTVAERTRRTKQVFG